MTTYKLSRLALVSFTLLLAVSCGSASDGDIAADDLAGGSTADRAENPATMLMRDSDIAGIALTANQGAVDLAELARTRATTDSVRRFADMMVTEHRDAIQKYQQMTARTGLKSTETALRTQLRSSGAATAEALRQRSGSDFDRAYIRTQIDMHQWLLDALDKSLIPGANGGALRSYLGDIRDSVANHLAEARKIESNL